jgi:hypothetical protein
MSRLQETGASLPMPELQRLRMNLSVINDRLSTLQAEAESLLTQRAPILVRIAELEDCAVRS